MNVYVWATFQRHETFSPPYAEECVFAVHGSTLSEIREVTYDGEAPHTTRRLHKSFLTTEAALEESTRRTNRRSGLLGGKASRLVVFRSNALRWDEDGQVDLDFLREQARRAGLWD